MHLFAFGVDIEFPYSVHIILQARIYVFYTPKEHFTMVILLFLSRNFYPRYIIR